MCGINGFIDKKRRFHTEELNKIIHNMNKAIVYRGPDHEAVYIDENVAMGMRRLAIIDLKDGNQPIYNETRNLIIVFNGEIYNYRDLKNMLIKSGHHFYTNTDTEVIIHTYEEYGIDGFALLDGMFAFSIYDKEKRRLVIARDCMGEKPLYYYCSDEWFLWGSELKSLLATKLIEKNIQKRALNQYLQLTYIPAPLTIFEHVYKLLPGHVLTYDMNGDLQDRQYWDLETKDNALDITYEEAKKELKKLLGKSVRSRMVSDVPLGAFLSGGVDSSTIVSLMSRFADTPVETFTAGYEEEAYDERQRARMIVNMNHTHHHEKMIKCGDMLESIEGILSKIDEPFSDPSLVPTYFISKYASENVKVVLTGDAGDELFLGYSKYLIDYYGGIYNNLPVLIQRLFEKIFSIIPKKYVITRKLQKVIDNAYKDVFEKRVALMSLGFKEGERKQLLNSMYFDTDSMSFLKEIYDSCESNDEWKRTQYLDIKVVLEGDMLPKVDRMSMLNSLETRVPMLNKDFVQFAYNLPTEYKIKGKSLKIIFKDAFKNLLPANFCNLPKSGFDIPIDEWFRSKLKEDLLEMLDENMIKKQGIFEYQYIRQIITEHMSYKKNRGRELWTLFVFQKWYKYMFISET